MQFSIIFTTFAYKHRRRINSALQFDEKEDISYFNFCFVAFDTQVIRISLSQTYPWDICVCLENVFDNLVFELKLNFDKWNKQMIA